MPPSTQCFETFDDTGGKANDWLILEEELIVLDGKPNVTFQRQTRGCDGLHLGVKDSEAASSARLRVVHCCVGLTNSVGRRFVFGFTKGDSDTGSDRDFMSAYRKRFGKR